MSVYEYRVDWWRAQRDGMLVEDISECAEHGMVEFNADRRYKKQGSLSVLEGEGLVPYQDYAAPFMVLTDPDGVETSEQLGLFTLRTPHGRRRSNYGVEEYDLFDLTYELGQDDLEEPWEVADGVKFTDDIVAVIEDAGISWHAIPDRSATVSGAKTRPAGSNRLDIINEGLNAIGLYTAGTDATGKVTTAVQKALHLFDPTMTLTNADIAGEVADAPPDRDPVNLVIAIKDRPNEARLESIQANDDPDSPTSRANLGRTISRTEFVSDIDSQTALDDYALALLSEGRSYYQTLELVVKPTAAFGIRDVVDLNFTGSLAVYNGRYWVRTWSMGLSVNDPTVELSLNRTTDLWKGLTPL